MAKTNFKVIIAGGSVAGLSLASMLEQQGIDFLLLEAYGDIAPDVGASLGLFPNGLRIMDQIGCFEAISELRIPPFQSQDIIDSKGRIIFKAYGMAEHFERRFGYPVCFIDRQQLIRILYEKLQHKDKVLVNKRVERVDMSEDDVTVTTTDGDTFKGSLVVGADGVHSKVRQHMWRVANEIEPGTFDEKEENEVPCYFKCIFGISKPGTFPEGLSGAHVLANKNTMLLVEGPGSRAYFFLFAPVLDGQSPVHGKEIPRYTKEDEAELVKEHWDVPILEGKLTFGDIYKGKVSSTLVPLQEHVYKKWFYRRVMTIGDAAHKQDALGGQGGNGAIETAAALTNALVNMFKEQTHHDHPSAKRIDAALAEAQDVCYERAVEMVSIAHLMQKHCWKMKSPLGESLVRILTKLIDPSLRFHSIAAIVEGGPKLDGVIISKRPGAFPFTDELPSKPIRGTFASWLPAILAATLLGLLDLFRDTASGPSIAVVDRPLVKSSDEWLLANSTGGLPAGISALLLPISRSTALGGMDPVSSLAGGQYLIALFYPMLVVWYVESHRYGNKFSPMSLMGVFGAMSQLFGITRVAPFYYILSIITGSNSMVGRRVPDEVAHAIVPTIVVGHAILNQTVPLFGNAIPSGNFKDLWWILVPTYFVALNKLIKLSIRMSQAERPKEDTKISRGEAELLAYAITHASPLRRNYAAAFALSALVHIGLAVRYVYTHQFGLSFVQTLSTASLSQDIMFHGLLLTVYLLYTVWDMRRRGYITTSEAAIAAAAVATGQMLVGPGATYAGTWYWREGVLTRCHDSPGEGQQTTGIKA